MDTKASRRELIQNYKNRKTPRGIFAVRCTATDEVWIGSSPNLDGARNSLWFQLNNGNHRNRSLQAAWTTHGQPAFQYEVLEQLDDDVAAFDVRDLLKERLQAWAAEMNAPLV